MPDWIISLGVIPFIIIVLLILASLVLVIWLGIKAHKNKVSAGKEDLVGRTAIVETALEPKGVVQVEGERWTAFSESGNIEPESEVVITKVEGLKLRVTKKI